MDIGVPVNYHRSLNFFGRFSKNTHK